MIYNSLIELIGNTPMLRLEKYEKKNNCVGEIYVKLESFNPLGSVKDRAAFAMIEAGEKNGKINKDTVIVEPSSGNTGIGLAFVCAVKGYKLIVTMPETMSVERRKLITSLGGEIVLTEGKKGMKGAIEKANEIASENKNSFVPNQFTNKANPEYHSKTTAQEIIRDMEGDIDIFVSGVGTGGTITGVGSVLKDKIKNVEIIAVEPMNSAVLSGENAGPHKIQGIGAGFIPEILDVSIFDKVIKVENESSYEASRNVAVTEGLLVGISSGAALYAATEVAKKEENRNKKIVVVLPDTGERYLSTELF